MLLERNGGYRMTRLETISINNGVGIHCYNAKATEDADPVG